MYQVLLTTSGQGQRLGNLTQFTNKSLVPVGHKPAISYIIEYYPLETQFVITLGYYGNYVQQFLTLAYPDRHFTFVEVDKYEGAGSSLAYSILQAQSHITGPFIFHACDTIIRQVLPPPETNWLAGFTTQHSAQYVSFDVQDNQVIRLKGKGELNYDYSYIGVAGIYHYQLFFSLLQQAYQQSPNDTQLSDVIALSGMLSQVPFTPVIVSQWLDIGNVDGLKKAREIIPNRVEILDKAEESLFIFPDFVIKFFHQSRICLDRTFRGKQLYPLVPYVIAHTDNFYKYQLVEGKLLADTITPEKIVKLLSWGQQYLWKSVNHPKFPIICHKFYFEKTLQRIKTFLTETGITDQTCLINQQSIPSVQDLLQQVDINWLCRAEPVQFHGDFILDNILETEDSFVLLDWRQDFGGALKAGDIYYDLAKLYHNLIFNHSLVNRNLFTIEITKQQITCDILQSHNLVLCGEKFIQWIQQQGYDLKKIKVLTSLIWINMAGLHQYPLNTFLWYFGQWHLFQALNG